MNCLGLESKTYLSLLLTHAFTLFFLKNIPKELHKISNLTLQNA